MRCSQLDGHCFGSATPSHRAKHLREDTIKLFVFERLLQLQIDISPLQGKVLHCVGDEAECFLFTLVLVQQTQSLTTSRSTRVEIRLLSKACHASTMPGLLATIIPACVVDGDSIEKLAHSRHCLCGLMKECLPVIPQCTGPRSPFESQLNVDVALINVIQVIQNHIALGPV